MADPDPAAVAATQGAQVVLPPDSKASQGARGVFATVQENTEHRDAGYVEMGLDPQDPSGHLTDDNAPPPVEPPPPETVEGGMASSPKPGPEA